MTHRLLDQGLLDSLEPWKNSNTYKKLKEIMAIEY